MTAIVQAPVDALRNQFDKLTTALAGPTLPSSEVQYNKVKLDEDAKRVSSAAIAGNGGPALRRRRKSSKQATNPRRSGGRATKPRTRRQEMIRCPKDSPRSRSRKAYGTARS